MFKLKGLTLCLSLNLNHFDIINLFKMTVLSKIILSKIVFGSHMFGFGIIRFCFYI